MEIDDEIERLEKELTDMKESQSRIWDRYGSEICPEDLRRTEKELEKKIEVLKKEKEQRPRFVEDPKYIIDN